MEHTFIMVIASLIGIIVFVLALAICPPAVFAGVIIYFLFIFPAQHDSYLKSDRAVRHVQHSDYNRK